MLFLHSIGAVFQLKVRRKGNPDCILGLGYFYCPAAMDELGLPETGAGNGMEWGMREG